MKVFHLLTLAVSSVLALATTGNALAQNTSPYTEHGKLMRAPEAISALGADLFGDQVNLYSGTTEFVQTDVSLPGNFNIPVRVGRRFVGGRDGKGGGLFEDWDLDVPHSHIVNSIINISTRNTHGVFQ